ncbi:MAG: AbrB/MazE/SpoVT family DNA-binding domain-containing protein [Geoalkalibacter sp.]|jgi:AbrB family looped-hinge helix DNA binding protein|uniref:AbrB/MazE/SpoVT family DNA-binding domain-containing protein n=1 Tax=Geoalkalibacter sp. TaxID=3041440 RepID=UPI002AA04DC2|nr:AbrB/MazE/SpoVT family DNA-binding domain-containing protein [Thermodesulfobacteriota bacterium]
MRENIIVSSRGQITLPAEMRKKLGIQPGGVLIAEERNGEVVLRPAAVLEIEMYSDQDIAQWDKDDQLLVAEKEAILKKLKRRQ